MAGKECPSRFDHVGDVRESSPMATATLPPGFNGLQYIASYPDLIRALGANRAAGERHYLSHGRAEGRAPDTFDLPRYLDNNPDVAAAFGSGTSAATVHFIQFGFAEGRNDDPPPGLPPRFDGLQYIASHPDLIQALDRFGGERHYLAHGQAEGRARDTFDTERYLDNNPEVEAALGTGSTAATTHYIRFGFAEGRTDDPPTGFPPGFDGLQYIASYPDLIQALGADRFDGERHYLAHGQAEDREIDTFDQTQYLENYPDLQAAFGASGTAAAVHYIEHGFAEGRTDDPLTTAATTDFLF
jgi:hypothetical protein